MKRLTTFKTNRILAALCKGNRKPLQKFIRELLENGTHRYWSDLETLLVKSIEYFCLEHGFVQDAQDIIRFTGFDTLLDLPESAFQIAVSLVEKGDEAFVVEAFNGLDDPASLGRLSEAKSKLLLNAASKAMELGRDNIGLSVYRAALSCEARLDGEDTHPLVLAARDDNQWLGKAYRDFYNEHYPLRFNRYKNGYLEELVMIGNTHYIRLALECNGNIHAPISTTGQSLLDIAPNDDVRKLLEEFGGKPGDRKIYLLRQAIISIEKGEVNHEVMKEIFSYPEPLLEYSFYESTHPTVALIKWDLIFTAAKYRSVPALNYMMGHLKNNCTDDDLDKLLTALLGVDTMARAHQNHESAKQIIDVLELLISHEIFFVDPWKCETDEYRMIAGFNSKVARILNLACYNPENASKYPEEDFTKIAMDLWKIGNIYGTAGGTKDMLLLGINHQKKFLLEACLAEFHYDFALLDTEKTSAVWYVVGNELSNEDTAKDLLDFAIQNGADINHQTIDGFTALHAAHRYSASMDFSPVKLLLAAGADPNIADRFGRKPKDVSEEKYVSLSGGFTWPK